MDKLTAIKIKYDDGTYSDEIPVSVLSKNVEWDSAHTLVDVLGSIDVDVTGTIQGQINQLFNEKVNSSEITALESRIDNLMKLEPGSTTGDAELMDIRVGADGNTYNSAGAAIRTQVSNLNEGLNLVNDGYYAFDLIPNKYILRDNGKESGSTGWSATGFIPVPDNSLVICNSPSSLSWGALYDKDKQYISSHGWQAGKSESFFHDGELRYFRISGASADMASLKYKILPSVDTGLTKRGYPADAYIVGDNLKTANNRLTVLESAGTQVSNLNEGLNLVNDGYYAFDLIPNKYILRDNGKESNYTGWSATGFIPVPDNSLVICNSPSSLPWGALYDKDKNYVSAYGWSGGETKNFFHDGELRYFRISGANADMANLKYMILPSVDATLTKIGYPADAKTVGDRLNAMASSLSVVPNYYKTQLATKEATIRGHFGNCAYSGDGLVFLTDTHFSADLFTSNTPTSNFNANNSFALIKDVIDNTGIDKIVFGGDLVNSATDIDTMLLSMASFQTRFGNRQARLRYCVGNHEYFTGSDLGRTTKPTPSELYGAGIKYNEDIVLGKGDMDTYYFDNKVQNIRYFVVSCGRNTETSTAQVKWVLEQFKAVPRGYKIICIGHGFMADNMVAFRGGYKPIADALDAVKVGGTYTYVYGTNLSTEYDYSTLVDVTPVCMITGHTHIDGSLTTDGGIPCICTTTDSYALNYKLIDGTPTSTPRTKGTVNEQAFDVFQFDFTNRKIYCTRIGYGSDREFSY